MGALLVGSAVPVISDLVASHFSPEDDYNAVQMFSSKLNEALIGLPIGTVQMEGGQKSRAKIVSNAEDGYWMQQHGAQMVAMARRDPSFATILRYRSEFLPPSMQIMLSHLDPDGLMTAEVLERDYSPLAKALLASDILPNRRQEALKAKKISELSRELIKKHDKDILVMDAREEAAVQANELRKAKSNEEFARRMQKLYSINRPDRTIQDYQRIKKERLQE